MDSLQKVLQCNDRSGGYHCFVYYSYGAAGAFSKFLYMKDLPGMIAKMIFSVTTNKFVIMIL